MAGTRTGAGVEAGMGWEDKSGAEEPRKVKHGCNSLSLPGSTGLLRNSLQGKLPGEC